MTTTIYTNCCIGPSTCDVCLLTRGEPYPGLLRCVIYDNVGSGTHSSPHPSCVDGVRLDLIWDEGLSSWVGTATDTCGRALTVTFICADGELLTKWQYSTHAEAFLTYAGLNPGGSIIPQSCSVPLINSAYVLVTYGAETFSIYIIVSETEYTYP